MFYSTSTKLVVSAFGLFALIALAVVFGGCNGTSKLSGADGKPINMPAICSDVPGVGKVCFTPGQEPPPQPLPGYAATAPPAPTPRSPTLEK